MKSILILLTAVFSILNLTAQNKIDILSSTIWETPPLKDGVKRYKIFEIDKFYNVSIIDGESEFSNPRNFYLSETMDEFFDESKIGTQNGKYLVTDFIVGKKTIIYDIVYLTNEKLVLKPVIKDKFIGRGEPLEIIYVPSSRILPPKKEKPEQTEIEKQLMEALKG